MAQDYTADFSATLSSSYTSGATTLVLSTVSGLPTSGKIFYLQVAAEGVNTAEYFKCTSYTGTTLTVAGAQQGSAASNHASGATITGCWWLPVVIDGVRSDASQVGVFASLPVSGMKAGDRYRCTDSPYEAIYDGSNWRYFIGGHPEVTPPPSAGWTADSPTVTSTKDSTYGTLMLVFPNSASVQFSCFYRTAPATPYFIKALVRHNLSGISPGSSSGDNNPVHTFQGITIGFRDSSNGKLVIMRITNDVGFWTWNLQKWTTTSSYSADYSASAASISIEDSVMRNPMWIGIKDDGTNFSFWWSLSGIGDPTTGQWKQFGANHSRTDFIGTPGQIIIGGYNRSDSIDLEVLSWGS